MDGNKGGLSADTGAPVDIRCPVLVSAPNFRFLSQCKDTEAGRESDLQQMGPYLLGHGARAAFLPQEVERISQGKKLAATPQGHREGLGNEEIVTAIGYYVCLLCRSF